MMTNSRRLDDQAEGETDTPEAEANSHPESASLGRDEAIDRNFPTRAYGLPVIDRVNHALIFDDWPQEILERRIKLTLGAKRRTKDWRLHEMDIAELLSSLSRPKVGPKDGLMFMPGELLKTSRKASEVTRLNLVTLDCDNGFPLGLAARKLHAAGHCFAAYTSHSNGKDSSEISLQSLREMTRSANVELSDELVQAYLLDQKKYWPSVAKSARIREIQDDRVVVHHSPMSKFRVVMPLERSFVVAGSGRNYREAGQFWSRYVSEIATKIGLQIDPACLDLSRAYYSPRCAPRRQFICLIGGKSLLPGAGDWALAAPAAGRRKSRNGGAAPSRKIQQSGAGAAQPPRITAEIASFLRSRGDKFDVIAYLDAIGWEIRDMPNPDRATIRCPNDDQHSNPGDAHDMGCVAMNPSEAAIGRAVITCRHGHCQGLGIGAHLTLILEQSDDRT